MAAAPRAAPRLLQLAWLLQVVSSYYFAPSSLAVMRLGSGSESTTPGTALPVYFDEVSTATGAVLSSVLYTGNMATQCTLPAPGASNSTWLYDSDGVPASSLNGISWPCYPAAVGANTSMEALKTFVYVGADMNAPLAFPVTTLMGVRATGVSGVRQLLTIDGTNFWVVGNAATYNGLQYWANGGSGTSNVSGGVNASQPGYDDAVSVCGSQTTPSSSITLVSSGAVTGGVYNVSAAVTGRSVALFQQSVLALTAFTWTGKAGQFWVAYDNGPGHRGTIVRYQLLTLQLNTTIDVNSPIYSMWGNWSGEYYFFDHINNTSFQLPHTLCARARAVAVLSIPPSRSTDHLQTVSHYLHAAVCVRWRDVQGARDSRC